MMKQPQFASRLRLSKICRLILTLGVLKLTLLGVLMLVPMTQEELTSPSLSASASPSGVSASASASGDSSLPSVTGEVAPPPSKAPTALERLLNKANPVRGQFAHAAEPAASTVAPPPAPKIRSGQSSSPFAAQSTTPRPDDVTPSPAPAPQVSPFVPRDSAQRKQEELNRREQELLALQQQMESRLEELRSLEGKIQDMLKQANTVQDDKLKHLIDVYTNMKAKQAAAVLETLDERIAVRILAGMRGKQAGEILTYMQAEPAAKLSELLSRTQLPDR